MQHDIVLRTLKADLKERLDCVLGPLALNGTLKVMDGPQIKELVQDTVKTWLSEQLDHYRKENNKVALKILLVSADLWFSKDEMY